MKSKASKKRLLAASPLQGLLRRIDNLSIRAKLFSYAGVLIILMLGLALLVFIQISNVQNRLIPARAAARDMEASLLTMRTHELNFVNEADSLNAAFYEQHRSVSVDAWRENYRLFEASYNKLRELYQDSNVGKELTAVQPLIADYRDSFLALNGAYRERGYQSYGREGVLHERSTQLLKSLEGNAPALTQFLKAQDAQNRFLLYRELDSAKQFRAQATAVEQRLVAAEQKTLFAEYLRLFEDVVSIYQKIGLTTNDGLRGKLNQRIAEIMPHIKNAEAEVLSSTSNSIGSIARSTNITTLLLSIAAILCALLLAKLILNKIARLNEASQHFTKGDLTYRIAVTTKDELGQLAHSFNDMASELQQGRKKLHERAAALSQSVRRFELVSRAVNEAIYEWDINSGRLKWGQGIVSVFGYKPSDMDTTIEWWTERVHSEDADDVNDSLDSRIRRQSTNWHKEYRFKRASGEYVYCQDRGFIEYRNGEAVRMVGSIVDISRQKALDHAKDEFISVASHQLRTPLGSIRWNLELLLEEKKQLSSYLTELAQEAYNSTLRMTGLVADLLSVARIEQDRVQNIPEPSDLVEITKAALVEMQPIAQRRNVHINTSGLAHKRTNLVIDPKRFREVIQNILSNAVKYTPAKGTVSVGIEKRAKDFVVSVSDTGIGIPLEDQSKMFGKFYRASNVTVTDTEGSGLGLFVVRSYVESWGGKVWFTSRVNEGTTFYISVPHKPRIPKAPK